MLVCGGLEKIHPSGSGIKNYIHNPTQPNHPTPPPSPTTYIQYPYTISSITYTIISITIIPILYYIKEDGLIVIVIVYVTLLIMFRE
jgi:hypothetical protein